MKISFIILLFTVFSCASTKNKESLGEFVDNTTISSKIKTRFVEDSNISATSIHVESFKGRVILSGFVDSEFQKRRAIEIAEKVQGVKIVSNMIIIK
jgi:hyperosmotically inducible protein